MRQAIVLVSGGLDSCVAAAWAKQTFDECFPIRMSYGQRHAREMVAAENICESLGFPFPLMFNLNQPFALIGGSSLTSGERDGNPSTEPVQRTSDSLPATFVPGRNVIFLSLVAAMAYTRSIPAVVGGWNAVDYSGYPDCRPEFFDDMQSALRRGLDWTEFQIYAPLVNWSKETIVRKGVEYGAPMNLSWSCYSGGSTPCGICDSCKIRAEGFAKAGIPDPALEAGR